MSDLRNDIVDEALLESPYRIEVIKEEASHLYSSIVNQASAAGKTVTPGVTKDIIETMDLIGDVILNYQDRVHATEDSKVKIVYEKPDIPIESEVIEISIADRNPGQFSQGSTFEGGVKNRRPLLREEREDPDNPGYRRAVLGYFHDNVLRLTCWARTNKEANKRALWLEQVMEEYAWYFARSGVNRLLYEGWRVPEVINIDNNRFYGRPIDYFVRTERLTNVSQKVLEEICLRIAASSGT
jgi:hypothetical protein